MSEYQYYEFRAIDRPLSQKERDELRAISTRAEITTTSLTNTYHWGDFKGNPATLMDRYFDAFVYVANWGSHRLMLRIPRGLLDPATASAYCDDETLSIEVKKPHLLLDFRSEDEGGDDWSAGEDWMSSLISLRAELMRGDTRALYLGWLASLPHHGWDWQEDGDEDAADDWLEPSVPPGLAKLSGALTSLAKFLRVEDELIAAAASGSLGQPPAEPSSDELARWVKKLPIADKDAYLSRLLSEEESFPLHAELLKRFFEDTVSKGGRPAPGVKRRTVSQLLAARDSLVEAKTRSEAELARKEKDRREREQAEALTKRLDDLARREPAAWREVEELIGLKQAKEYDRAVALLVDLRELAQRSGRLAEVEQRIQELRQRHRSKSSLMNRLNSQRLGS
jgi:hypothetical protein